MDEMTADRLLALNWRFYEQLAAPFARTRSRPQPGFVPLLSQLPSGCDRLLDVGCGEGRFGRFVLEEAPFMAYTGVDFSTRLLEHARAAIPSGTFFMRDLSEAGALQGLGEFPAIACLAVLQHIPGRANRVRLLRELGAHLAPGGRIFISTWQFMQSERQRRKVVDWGAAGLDPAAVEPDDYLLTWQSGGFGLRYVCYIDEAEMAQLAANAGLVVVQHFRSDGREGNLNLYAVLEHAADDPI